jgi:signal transduction histidine kinase
LYSKKVKNPVGLTDQELFDDKEMALRFREMDQEVIRNGQKKQFFEKVKDSKGNVHTDITVKVPIKRKEGAPLLLGMSVDMTELLEKEENLRLDNLSLSMACQMSGIFPWKHDVKNEITTFKLSSSEGSYSIEFKRDELYRYIHPEDFGVFLRETDKVHKGIADVCDFELRCCYVDGKYHWYSFHGRTYKKDEQMHPSIIVGIMRDISDEKRNIENLNARRLAEESNRMKDAFIANMSHEIRTPLNAIVGFSQLLADSSDEEQRCEFARIIEKNNTLLLRIVDDILDISQLESGSAELEEEPFPMNQLFEDLLPAYQFRVEPGVTLSLELPEKNYIFESDRPRFKQLLSNLLSNSTKFTEKGSISYGYEPRENGVYVYVKDTGIGMQAKAMAHIFERFEKIDPFKQGTGLGLSICKMIVDKLNGKIGVMSTPGEGSTFWFEIPGKISMK